MLVKNAENREQLEFVSLENMVPQDHLLRKIDDAIDFKKIYEFVEDLYCEDNGRPSVDPVVLFKIVLIQHIYGISSLRRTLEEVSMNLAYRWFIGYPLNEAVPAFLHGELQLQAPIQPRHGGICVPLGVESTRQRKGIWTQKRFFVGPRNPH